MDKNDRKTKKKPTKPSYKSYILKCGRTSGGIYKRRIIIPSNSRLTFGPTAPFAVKSGMGHHPSTGMWALRVYVGNALQAIYTDVIEFENTTIVSVEEPSKEEKDDLEKANESASKGWIGSTYM